MKKRLPLLAFLLSMGAACFAQLEFSPFVSAASGFSVTKLSDYQSLNVNPANLGTIGTRKFHFGILETSIGIYSEPLSRSQIFNDFFASNFKFNDAQRTEAIDRFTNTRILLNGAVNWLGISYQDEKAGGFAFTISDRLFFDLLLNHFTSEMLFLGYNANYFDQKERDVSGKVVKGIATQPKLLSELGKGAEANFTWYREYNFGYGRNLIKNDDMKLNIGIGLKYLQGFAYAQYFIDEDTGVMTGVNSMAPLFRMDLGDNSLSPVSGTGLVPVGSGFGVDIGFSGIVGQKIKWGLSVNDMGSVKWKGNVYKGDDVYFTDIDTDGINSYNIFAETPDIEAIAGFDWVNIPPITTKLPMNIRAGASYQLSGIFEVGGEIYYPLRKYAPGGYNFPVISAGASVNLKFVEIEGGLNYNKYYGLNTPLAFLFRPINSDKFLWEIGIGSRDLVGLFQQNNPSLSVALAFIRFGF